MKKITMMIVALLFWKAGLAQNQDVQFKNASGTINFGATVSLPKQGNGNAVVLVSGTGKQDRNGTMAGHAWFTVLADYLRAQGLVVLRMDDRGVGQTTGVYETATTGDFADDALSAVAYLKSRKDLKLKKIGLLGHSEGGAAISIAGARSKDISFLISLSGLATSGMAAQIYQNEDLVAASSLPDHDKKRSNEINRLMFQTAFQYADSVNMEAKINEVYQEWKVKDDAYFKTLNIEFDHFRFPIYSYSKNSAGNWYRYFIKYDPANYLPKLKVPILAINGSKDLMVKAGPNLENWKNLPAKGGNKNVTVKEMPGLNHLLQHCTTCQPQEYASLKETIAVEVLNEIGNWLKSERLGN